MYADHIQNEWEEGGCWSRNSTFWSSYLHEKYGQAGEGQHQRVGDQERSSAVPKAQDGEPPDIAEADGVAEAGEEEVALVVPIAAVGLLFALGGLLIVIRLTHLARNLRHSGDV